MPGSRKNFLTAISISAAAHLAAGAAILFSLAPVPAVLLPFNSRDRGIISVSLVDGLAGGQKSKEIRILSRSERREAPRGEIERETKKDPTAPKEAKNGLTENKIQLSYAALDVYTNGRSKYSDRANGSPEKMPGNSPVNGRAGGAYNGTAGNGPSEGARAPVLIPAYRQNNPPRYPATARLRGYEGLVLVSAEILADGTVGNIKLKRSSGYAALDDSAVEAVRKWLFHPGRQMGVAVSMWVDVPIRFALNE